MSREQTLEKLVEHRMNLLLSFIWTNLTKDTPTDLELDKQEHNAGELLFILEVCIRNRYKGCSKEDLEDKLKDYGYEEINDE